METRAPFVIVGAFVLAAILAVFGFVYWLHNTGGLGARTEYHVQFEGSVPGLLVGAGVLFNGIRVGEVTGLALAPDDARRVNATISVAVGTPVRPDTKVGLEFQGLTGVPVVALEGGRLPAGSGKVTTLVAETGAGQSMTQAARDALRKVDSVLSENAEPLKNTIANLQVFSEGLARNTGKLDSIVAGLEKMTGGGPAAAPKTTYDLQAARVAATPGHGLKAQFGLPEPTAIAMLQTQRFLFSPTRDMPGFADAMWADSIPKLLQARLIEGFENYDLEHAPLRAGDTAAEAQLVLDVRRFDIALEDTPTAEILLSARILDKDGKVVASHLFEQREKLDRLEPADAVVAFNGAFARISKDIIGWTASVL